MAQPPSSSAGVRQPTASEALFIIGALDIQPELVPDGPARQLGMELRGSRAHIAPQLVAAAFWNLQHFGVVGLELKKGKSLGFISRTELVAVMRGGPTSVPGIEGELLAMIVAGPPREIGRIVRDWFGKRVRDANPAVVDRVLAHCAQAGLVELRQEDTGRGAVAGLLLGRTRQVVIPKSSTIAAAGTALADMAGAWLAFRQAAPELAEELVTRCRKAIESREFSDSDDGGGSGGSDLD